jgi:hypothetical protein
VKRIGSEYLIARSLVNDESGLRPKNMVRLEALENMYAYIP